MNFRLKGGAATRRDNGSYGARDAAALRMINIIWPSYSMGIKSGRVG